MPKTPTSDDAKFINELTLAKLEVPGPLIKPVPSFDIGVPQGWVVGEFPGALFGMAPAPTWGGPWSNILVKHERVLATTTLEDVAKSTWAALKAEFPDAEVLDDTAVTFEETHYLRTTTLTMEGWDGVINRSDSFVFAPGSEGPTGDLFQFVCMNAVETTTLYAELYAGMLATLHFT